MSNPAVMLLAETNINNTRIRIEDNLAEAIHIHVGAMRIDLTVDEFYKMYDAFFKAAKELLELQGIDIKHIDTSSLDWMWLHRYEHVKSVKIKRVKVRDLYTVNDFEDCPGVQNIVPINKMRQYEALFGQNSSFARYNQINVYGQTNIRRLDGVLKCIEEYGYPYDDKYIMVNQYNQIYDGDHRAACIAYLYGLDREIPVRELFFDDVKPIEQQIKQCLSNKDEFLKRKIEPSSDIRYWSEDKNIIDETFSNFISSLATKFEYVLIPKKIKINGICTADNVVILKPGVMIQFCKEYGVSYYGASYFRKYSFLYGMQRCVTISFNDCSVILFDAICCKSILEDAFVPLEKSIQKFIWIDAAKGLDTRRCLAGNKTQLLYVIVNCVFNKKGFETEDIDFINLYKNFLYEREMGEMLRKIFFNFTDILIKCLKNNRLSNIVDEYIRFKEY